MMSSSSHIQVRNHAEAGAVDCTCWQAYVGQCNLQGRLLLEGDDDDATNLHNVLWGAESWCELAATTSEHLSAAFVREPSSEVSNVWTAFEAALRLVFKQACGN